MLIPHLWLRRIGKWLSTAVSRRLAIQVDLVGLRLDVQELTHQLDWGRD